MSKERLNKYSILFRFSLYITILIIIARLSTHCPRLTADCASLIHGPSCWLDIFVAVRPLSPQDIESVILLM